MAGGLITRSSHPDLLWPGVKAIWGNTYNELPKEWTELFRQETGTKFAEKYVEVTGFGLAPRKSEGKAIEYDSDGEGTVTTITPIVYGLGYAVTREELEDDQYEQVSSRRSEQLAFSMNQTVEIVHANQFIRGFSAAYPIGDGQAWFSNAHPTLGGTQSNLAPTGADLSEASLEDQIKRIGLAQNSKGLQIALKPTKLVVSMNDAFNATRILNSQLRSGTANNDINAIKAMGMLAEGAVVNHYFGLSNAWYILTDAPQGLVSIWRRQPSLEKDNDFDTENAKAKSTMRFAPGVIDWRAGYGVAPH